MAQAAWRGRIFLDAGTLLYVGPGASGDQHAHNAVQLVWSRYGAFELAAAGRHVRRCAVLVPSAADHALDATGSAIAAGFSDAAHFSRTFRAMFGLRPSLVLPVAEIIGRARR